MPTAEREREREKDLSISRGKWDHKEGRKRGREGRGRDGRGIYVIGEKKDTAAAKRDPSESRVSPQVGRFDFDTQISFYPRAARAVTVDLGTYLWIYET